MLKKVFCILVVISTIVLVVVVHFILTPDDPARKLGAAMGGESRASYHNEFETWRTGAKLNIRETQLDYYQPVFKAWRDGLVTKVNPSIHKKCSKLLEGDKHEIKRVRTANTRWSNSVSDEDFLEKTNNCTWVQEEFSENLYTTELEKSFPIAFTFLIYNSPQQVVRLLKVVYRPHNLYCIHPDNTSSTNFISIFRNIASCLSNVHISSKMLDVEWGESSIMNAQMICLGDLLDLRDEQTEEEKWKYVINLCGKELPLTTNHEMVSKLVSLNGSSSIAALPVPLRDHQIMSRLKHHKLPFNLRYSKSSNYMGISHQFAEYLMTSPLAIGLRWFFQKCVMPEEHYYATLYLSPGVPGGYKRHKFKINHSIWQIHKHDRNRCSDKVIHYICIVNVGDLKVVLNETGNGKYAFFYNKYFMEYDHAVMDCMEEELVRRNKHEFLADNKDNLKPTQKGT